MLLTNDSFFAVEYCISAFLVTLASSCYLQVTATKKDWEVLIGKSSLRIFLLPVM